MCAFLGSFKDLIKFDYMLVLLAIGLALHRQLIVAAQYDRLKALRRDAFGLRELVDERHKRHCIENEGVLAEQGEQAGMLLC